jgi:hypothetical protein
MILLIFQDNTQKMNKILVDFAKIHFKKKFNFAFTVGELAY